MLLIEYSRSGERKHRVEYALANTGSAQGDRKVGVDLVLRLRGDGNVAACVWGNGSLLDPTDEEKKTYEERAQMILDKERVAKGEAERRRNLELERAEREAKREAAWKEVSDGSGNVGAYVGSDQADVCEQTDVDGGSGEPDI